VDGDRWGGFLWFGPGGLGLMMDGLWMRDEGWDFGLCDFLFESVDVMRVLSFGMGFERVKMRNSRAGGGAERGGKGANSSNSCQASTPDLNGD